MEHRIHVQTKGIGRRQEPKPTKSNKPNNSNRLSLSVSQIKKLSFWNRHQSLPIHRFEINDAQSSDIIHTTIQQSGDDIKSIINEVKSRNKHLKSSSSIFPASQQQIGPKKSIVSQKSIQLLENKVNPISNDAVNDDYSHENLQKQHSTLSMTDNDNDSFDTENDDQRSSIDTIDLNSPDVNTDSDLQQVKYPRLSQNNFADKSNQKFLQPKKPLQSHRWKRFSLCVFITPLIALLITAAIIALVIFLTKSKTAENLDTSSTIISLTNATVAASTTTNLSLASTTSTIVGMTTFTTTSTESTISTTATTQSTTSTTTTTKSTTSTTKSTTSTTTITSTKSTTTTTDSTASTTTTTVSTTSMTTSTKSTTSTTTSTKSTTSMTTSTGSTTSTSVTTTSTTTSTKSTTTTTESTTSTTTSTKSTTSTTTSTESTTSTTATSTTTTTDSTTSTTTTTESTTSTTTSTESTTSTTTTTDSTTSTTTSTESTTSTTTSTESTTSMTTSTESTTSTSETTTSTTTSTESTTTTTESTTSETTSTESTTSSTTSTETTTTQSTSTTTTPSLNPCVSGLYWDVNGAIRAGDGTPGSTLAQLKSPSGLFIDANDTLYISDNGNYRVLAYLPNATNGTIVAGVGVKGNASHQLGSGIRFLYVDASENVYVSDTNNYRIMRWAKGSSVGVMVAGNGSNGTALGQLYSPYGVWVDSSSNVFSTEYSNHRLTKWAPGASEGELIAGVTGSPGNTPNKLATPTGLYYDELNQNLYLANSGTSDTVMRWTINGTNGTVIGGLAKSTGSNSSQLNAPMGLMLDQWQNVYVADRTNSRVQLFCNGSTTGITVVGNSTGGSPLGQAFDVKLDSKLNLYVVDLNGHRVLKFSKL